MYTPLQIGLIYKKMSTLILGVGIFCFKWVVIWIFLMASVSMEFDGFTSLAYAGEKEVLGRNIFRRLWAQSPASTKTADGLGPLFNARSCATCHVKGRKGTRKKGQYPRLLFRLNNDPVYGSQFQPFATIGVLPEGRISIRYSFKDVSLADGTKIQLRVPQYTVTKMYYGPLQKPNALSPRSAPSLRGVALLQAIKAKDIINGEKQQNAKNNDITGRVHWVKNIENGKMQVGRFGWKAIHPNVRQQNAGAFSGDIGISTALFPDGAGECTAKQKMCKNAPDGNDAEYDNLEVPKKLESVMLSYVLSLAPDTPRTTQKMRKGQLSERHRQGAKIFEKIGCAACHTPKYKVKGQYIYPYTDLLLHDMGADLADAVSEGKALGKEWKTPALWGNNRKGRRQKQYFLHDGRARTVQEAVLWHGGEAKKSTDDYKKLDKESREILLDFLKNL